MHKNDALKTPDELRRMITYYAMLATRTKSPDRIHRFRRRIANLEKALTAARSRLASRDASNPRTATAGTTGASGTGSATSGSSKS